MATTPFASTLARNKPQIGVPYYTWIFIRQPLWLGDAFMTKYVTTWADRWQGETIKVDSVAFWSPDETKRVFAEGKLPFSIPYDMASGRGKPWTAIIQWHKYAERSGEVVEAGIDGIVKVLIVPAVLFGLGVLVLHSITKSADELKGLVETATEGARNTVLNPGVLVLVVVGIALIVGARR